MDGPTRRQHQSQPVAGPIGSPPHSIVMPINITLQVKLSLEESALEDALEEYDELKVSELVKQVLDKAIALEEISSDITDGPNSLEEYDKARE